MAAGASAAAHVAAGTRTHAHEDLETEAHPDQGGLLIEYQLPSLVTHLGGVSDLANAAYGAWRFHPGMFPAFI